MQVFVISTALILLSVFSSHAQYRNKKETHYYKGQGFINGSVNRVHRTAINENYYSASGGKIGGGYYFLNRLGATLDMSIQNYGHVKNIQNNEQDKPFQNKNLVMAGANLRYHFWNEPGCATMFLQSGYSVGRFINFPTELIHRWNIGTFGITTPFLAKLTPNLRGEMTFNVSKDNLHNKPIIIWQSGINYNFGSLPVE